MSTASPQHTAPKLFAQPCEVVLAAAAAHQFPPGKLPEIAFVGRSNAGKSSLLNALVGRRNLARTSNTPGRTQQIVFFNLGKKLMLADLPGYGHAKAPRAEKDKWNELVQSYLQMRPTLTCVCLLIDARHGLKANDLDMMKFLDRAAASYQIVLTKTDKVSSAALAVTQKQTAALIAKHPAARAGVVMTSASKGLGIEELRLFLMQVVGL